jgi:hypothetical protein
MFLACRFFLNKKLCWIIGLTGLNVGHMGGPWGFARMGCFLMIALSANMYKCPEFCDIDFFYYDEHNQRAADFLNVKSA